MHNRMHDWSYNLGFTELTWNAQNFNFGQGGLGGDPEHGNAQAGAVVGGPPGFPSRDNANQFTPPEGVVPITNMFLWQPIPTTFYSPCVDGDYDMSVIAHEYGHLISNRMVGGPNAPLAGNQAQAMGESWSDLSAAEFLNSQGLVPIADENPFAVGPYATGDKVAGIRNYAMNDSPLNYSDVGYDFACNQAGICTQRTQVHADGEIWSATNFDIRQAMIAQYNGSFPASNIALQESCVAGTTPVTQCPGNRRWAQLYFDAFLLMASGSVSMVDARDALLAADLVRFGGAHQALLWNAFARRGLGVGAASAGTAAFDPTPSFESPFADNATVTFKAVGQADGSPVQLFVGRYEAAAMPIADTDPATPLGDTFEIVPGSYEFVARGNGFGAKRFTFSLNPGQVRDMPVNMSRNVASSSSGATASGDGVNLGALIDDTEATDWASLDGGGARQAGHRPPRPVEGVAPGAPRPGERHAAGQHERRERPGHPEPLHRAPAVRDLGVRGKGLGELLAGLAVHEDLHEPGGRVPVRGATAACARVDHALVRGPTDESDSRPPAGRHQPVHGGARVPGRPGRRSGQLDGLRREHAARLQRERDTRSRGRAAGLRALTSAGGRLSGASLPRFSGRPRSGLLPRRRGLRPARVADRRARCDAGEAAENATPNSDSVATIGATTDTVPR